MSRHSEGHLVVAGVIAVILLSMTLCHLMEFVQ